MAAGNGRARDISSGEITLGRPSGVGSSRCVASSAGEVHNSLHVVGATGAGGARDSAEELVSVGNAAHTHGEAVGEDVLHAGSLLDTVGGN